MTSTLEDLVQTKEIIVCCGSGGVGKTTASAAIAMHGAGLGLRACVVTIDPAKRLADALGLDALTNKPGRVDGTWPGELWAMMLDTKGTFDDLVLRYTPSDHQARMILANPMYRNISGALSGTQEYMAMEKLFELHHDGSEGHRFDLIVVDTPPTRNALDFLDAPRRLTAFLDNRVVHVLLMPTRAYLKAVSIATQTLLRSIARVVGAEVVSDAVAFFRAFEGMEKGFRDRGQAVLELLADQRTAFVVVTSPRRDAVEEAAFFADKLTESGLGVDALVVNRLHPRFGNATAALGSVDGPLTPFVTNLSDFYRVAEREEHHFASLAERVAPAPVSRVPFLADDVHDLEGLRVIALYLFGSAP